MDIANLDGKIASVIDMVRIYYFEKATAEFYM